MTIEDIRDELIITFSYIPDYGGETFCTISDGVLWIFGDPELTARVERHIERYIPTLCRMSSRKISYCEPDGSFINYIFKGEM